MAHRAAYNSWLDPQAYVALIYVWQASKIIQREPYSEAALRAGLDGHKHATETAKPISRSGVMTAERIDRNPALCRLAFDSGYGSVVFHRFFLNSWRFGSA